ncbi:MAG TPA: SDR family oxidoreductase [Pyrinomonadaceae bacterium]|nr:SDR family oxidoreductase [Pyrinomonadaceae bacterium]
MSYPFSLKGRVALVTGGSRGIGRAVTGLLATLGADVVVNYLRDEEAALSAVKSAENRGVRSVAIQADVSQLKDATHLVQATIDTFKHLDILICNAGIWVGDAVESISEELWDRTLDLNLKGTWSVCRAAVPFMKAQRFGRIIMVSSTAGQRGEANFSNYAASKGGQISLTKSLSSELAPFGINVNCVAPGWVVTDMSEGAFANEEELQVILKAIPRGKVATAEEIAGPIAFLCTEWADHITGEVLNVNGGSVLCG